MMKRQLLHTPEGVRDIYNEECEKKHASCRTRLKSGNANSMDIISIQTPTFEFFDIFGREIGTTPSKDLYKFFDREGNTLVLRPDITPSIARCSRKVFWRGRYCRSGCAIWEIPFINNTSYQGRLKESTQLGAEFIGRSIQWMQMQRLISHAVSVLSEGIWA